MGFSRTGKRNEKVYRFHKSTIRKFDEIAEDIDDLPARMQPKWARDFIEWVEILKASDGKLISSPQKELPGLDYREQETAE